MKCSYGNTECVCITCILPECVEGEDYVVAHCERCKGTDPWKYCSVQKVKEIAPMSETQ